MTTLQNVRFINRGFCWQSQFFTGTGRLGIRKFAAVVVYFEHPQHGVCLIDTGYGPDVLGATARLPARLLRWLTPLPKRQLSQLGVDGDDLTQRVETVFLSHFHLDHVGGAKQFNAAKFVYRASALAKFNRMSQQQQFRHGFLSALIPDDFVQRGQALDESQWKLDDRTIGKFPTVDYWGDGSLLLIDLPGHMLGHFGFVLNTDTGRLAYVVDAFWDYDVFAGRRKLPLVSRRLQHDYADYQDTQERLVALNRVTDIRMLACHCPKTQAFVENDLSQY